MIERNRQEQVWAGEFGTEYQARNRGMKRLNIAFFAKALARTNGIASVLEFGAGEGQNLDSIWDLMPVECTAVEINREATDEMTRACAPEIVIEHCSIFEYSPTPHDLVLTKGLLIHIPPHSLMQAYAKIYESSRRYILLCEYYSPRIEMIPYHGKNDMLWKGDYAGEMLKVYKDLRLIDYGFAYHGDPNWPQDDITWFLMEKRP